MAKRSGNYKSEKRKKELLRSKKQEEKRKKRFAKNPDRKEGMDLENPTHTANGQ